MSKKPRMDHVNWAYLDYVWSCVARVSVLIKDKTNQFLTTQGTHL